MLPSCKSHLPPPSIHPSHNKALFLSNMHLCVCVCVIYRKEEKKRGRGKVGELCVFNVVATRVLGSGQLVLAIESLLATCCVK